MVCYKAEHREGRITVISELQHSPIHHKEIGLQSFLDMLRAHWKTEHRDNEMGRTTTLDTRVSTALQFMLSLQKKHLEASSPSEVFELLLC